MPNIAKDLAYYNHVRDWIRETFPVGNHTITSVSVPFVPRSIPFFPLSRTD
jgi:hypothetical protein